MIYIVEDAAIEKHGFDRRLVPSDWRFAAAAVGMVRYFEYHKMDYAYDGEALLYRSEDIGIPARDGKESKESSLLLKEEEYFAFAEDFFRSEMHHCLIEDLLELPEELGKEQVKLVNAKLAANVSMRKVFKGYKYSEELREEIGEKIREHRIELTRETFRTMKSGYEKFANKNLLRTPASDLCRLVGFNVDMGRKTQGISYNFDFGNFNGRDAAEFDFIPFGFTKSYEGIFINNNFKMEDLIHTNQSLFRKMEEIKKEELKRIKQKKEKEKEKKKEKEEPEKEVWKDSDFRNLLFFSMEKGSRFVDYDVEIIVKERDEDYFKTLLIRTPAIRVFEKLRGKTESYENVCKALSLPCRLSSGDYLPMMKMVTEHILNQVHLDGIIETLLKDKPREDNRRYRHGFVVSQLIRINEIMYKGEDMMDSQAMKAAFAASKKVVAQLIGFKAENKIPSYRQKLISSLVFKNYDRFIEISLQLSSYTQVPMGFLYDLSENFEANKNIAYAFVNGLENFPRDKGGEKNAEK
ncbi:MAG: type I CRISPR-associated protein Cas8a1/Csx8 [Peptostreptococcaceae bacterium]|nr:type I CRISPR-associated protein Cas8a1/Csx8 [Peptostreptococcaceae bacterium]